MVDRASALLGLRTSTLIFTVIHSVNLVLITTMPEDLVWALSWCLAPLERLGLPMQRLGFQLLLALRFLPLVQEELQNLLVGPRQSGREFSAVWGSRPPSAWCSQWANDCWPTSCCGRSRGRMLWWPAAAGSALHASDFRWKSPARLLNSVAAMGLLVVLFSAAGTVRSDLRSG